MLLIIFREINTSVASWKPWPRTGFEPYQRMMSISTLCAGLIAVLWVLRGIQASGKIPHRRDYRGDWRLDDRPFHLLLKDPDFKNSFTPLKEKKLESESKSEQAEPVRTNKGQDPALA